eukprot:CAMPEP_0119422576 /NCGR_PEP_ID=MMETSP1335-20130426/28507_1 /TAXON_ID=259385 /ORGANISM="Chrysoculter rhomboideus, Strain RCC1486" /LENGTH=81 /DNA_ID=CAMNT_0007448033 /DNA_START=105 /DNA_END=350 /DNA_ORIENTATION=+
MWAFVASPHFLTALDGLAHFCFKEAVAVRQCELLSKRCVPEHVAIITSHVLDLFEHDWVCVDPERHKTRVVMVLLSFPDPV